MNNIIGQRKKHRNNYFYLSLTDFPSEEIKNSITPLLNDKANKAQFLLGKLSGITLLLPDIDFFITSYIMKDAESSSQIEGTQATMIEAFEHVADPDNLGTSDADDITHYVNALKYGLKRLTEDNFPLSLRFIREIHRELMQGARSSHFSDPGEFRKNQNWIGGTTPSNAYFVPPEPSELSAALNDLEQFMHKDFVHPVINSGLLHSQFETIHPFLDGNGRTGRLLIVFYLIKSEILDVPALFLSSYFKKHQKIYYEKLNAYHSGDVAGWLDFYLDGVIETANESIKIAGKITEQRNQDLEAISTFTKKTSDLALMVVKNLYRNPIATTNTIQLWIKQTRQGTNKFIKNLIDAGILKLHREGEGSKPALYIHSNYINIFYQNHNI